jgi:hypothetical protein
MGKVIIGFIMSLGGFINNQNGGVERVYPDLDTLRYAKRLQESIEAGHANKSVTDGYGKLKEDVTFRKKVAEQVRIGFELPTERLEVAPNCAPTVGCYQLQRKELKSGWLYFRSKILPAMPAWTG